MRMDKLIIAVACDGKMQWPRNPYCPDSEDPKAVSDEYIRSVNAGAAIAHTHSAYRVEREIRPDWPPVAGAAHGWLTADHRDNQGLSK